MKKILSLVLALIMVMSLFNGVTVTAATTSGSCGDNVIWNLDGNGLLTISGAGDMDDYEWDGSPWYDNRLDVEKVIISEGVTSIGKCAFWNCDSLEEIEIPDSVTKIGWGAFTATGITSLEISANVTDIDNGFIISPLLKTITVDPGNPVFTSSGNCLINKETRTLIAGCSNSVIPTDGSVRIIGESAFEGNYELTSISIPDTITKIGDWAFWSCSLLRNVNISANVTDIGWCAFAGCPEAKFSVAAGNENYYVKGNCLIEKDTKTIIAGTNSSVIPNDGSIEVIGESAFSCCNFEKVVIPSGVKIIESYAFEICENLREVHIPLSVEEIGYDVFYVYDESSLTDVYYEGTEAQWNEIMIGEDNEVLFSADIHFNSYDGEVSGPSEPSEEPSAEVVASGECGDNLTWELNSDGLLTISGTGSMTDYTKTSSVPWYDYRDSVKSVYINYGVTSIGNGAFYECSSLTEIVIPDSVTSIGFYAFDGCYALTDVYYGGTEEEWNKITIDSGNDYLKNANIHFDEVEELGVAVSGSVKAYGDASKDVTIELLSGGNVVDTKTVTGNSGTYTFEEVAEATYTIRVSKTKHATREYEITVGNTDVTQDVKIWLYGDVNADGVVNAGDTLQINRKVANLSSVFNQTADADYRFKVANITNITMNDTLINAGDTLQINRKVANMSSIFDKIA